MTILSSFAEAGFLATADDFGFDRSLKIEMYDAMNHSLDQLHGMWNEGLATAINFDPQNEQAHFYEKGAYTGLIGCIQHGFLWIWVIPTIFVVASLSRKFSDGYGDCEAS